MNLIQHIDSLLPDDIYDSDVSVKKYEARIIAEYVSGLNYIELLMGEAELNEMQLATLKIVISQRSTGMPLAYVLNSISFRELDLYVDERVLIPRQETELLVEHVLEHCKNIVEPNILEIGIGSGAISLSVAHENRGAKVLGVEISDDALKVANLNLAAVGSGASRVSFIQGNMFDALDPKYAHSFDVIVSNPPYIGDDERAALPEQVLKFEPEIALFADDEGFASYEIILADAKQWLKEKGVLFLEISPRHKDRILSQSHNHGFSHVEIYTDLSKRERIAVIKN